MMAVIRLAGMESKLFFRERQAVFWTFLFPVLMIWLFGAMFGSTKLAGMTYSDAYIPSWIAVNLLTTSLFTIGTTLASYRQTGVLRRLQATPTRSWVVLFAHMTYGLLVFLISAGVLVLFGALFFHLQPPRFVVSTLLAVVLSIVAIFPFGLLLSTLAKNARTAAAISSLVLNLMLFLSGATFPLQMMPHFLQEVAKFLPLYYVIDLLRETWNFSSIGHQTSDVLYLAGIAIVASVLAAKLFRWTPDSE